MPIVASGKKRTREESPAKILIRDKLKIPEMDKSAGLSSQISFSILVEQAIGCGQKEV